MSRISLDFETRSRANLRTVAHYKYSECPSTEVLILAVRMGEPEERNPVLTWDIRQKPNEAVALLRRAITEGWEITAWNAPFEWAILKNVCPRQLGLPVPDIGQMRCTAAVARSAGCPPSLEKAGDFLRVEQPKDRIGKQLIAKFSSPLKGEFLNPDDTKEITVMGEKMAASKAFDLFVGYCARDVEVECEIAVKLRSFELKGDTLASFLFDMRLNDRGIPVHIGALKNAQKLIEEHAAHISGKFRDLTGLSPSQTARVLEWMQERGYKGKKLNKEEREKHGSDPAMKPEAIEAMKLKAELSHSAVTKVAAMLEIVGRDGFMRGVFLWCGAQKTWRWTSKKPQAQNLRKPSKAMRVFMEEAFQDVANGIDLETLKLFYGNPYEVLASMSRYFIRFDGEDILDSDFSSVEAKILPSLIGCDRILAKFRAGEDPYTDAAKSILELVPSADRDMGKTLTLACQFGGGWRAVQTSTKGKLTEAECKVAVKAIRDVNPEFKPAWTAYFDGFLAALRTPGKWQKVLGSDLFKFVKEEPFPRMLMRLPSGRPIVYPYPQADPTTMVHVEASVKKDGKVKKTSKWTSVNGHVESDMALRLLGLRDTALTTYKVIGNFQTYELSFHGHVKGSKYGRVRTYGGDLLQSCIAGGTLVLTMNGPKPIEVITSEDLVWDGVEFVQCDGAIEKGIQECITIDGITATPDHDFMVDNCWRSFYKLSHDEASSQGKRLIGEAIREFNRGRTTPANSPHSLAGSLRLWLREKCERFGSSEISETSEESIMQPGVSSQRIARPTEARTQLPPASLDSRLHVGSMLSSKVGQLQAVRGAGNYSLRPLEGVHQFLQRYDRGLPEGASVGSNQQRWELRAGELSVGDLHRERSEQVGHTLHRHPMGQHHRERSRREIGDQLHDTSLSTVSEGSSGSVLPQTRSRQVVYDILNCGPRNRFAVLSESGILIAHNCTQGTGVDLLAHGCIKAEEAGYEPFLIIHDQCLAPARGDLQTFIDALCTKPVWYPDFPLEADGKIARSYAK